MDALIKRLAAASEVTPGKAADELDKIIHEIVRKLRDGESARLPGLGHFKPGRVPQFRPEKSDGERGRSGSNARSRR